MNNEFLPWQFENWQNLCRYIQQGRIPQALLITGGKGLGKSILANRFARALLCEQPNIQFEACGHCNSCRLINVHTHPDFINVQPEEDSKNIAVGQIRTLITQLNLKPQFERYRVVILNPADRMNNAAANAFLKCLEEPTERTTLILISDRPTKLPATIISRCQKLTVSAPDADTASQWLKQHHVHDHHTVLFALAQGAPLQALVYANDETLKQRQHCFNAWTEVAQHRRHPIFVAEEWLKLPESAVLFWITTWVMDLIRARLTTAHHEPLYNPDVYSSLKTMASKLNVQKLYQLYDVLLLSRGRLDTPINKQNLFEEILIQWADLNRSI